MPNRTVLKLDFLCTTRYRRRKSKSQSSVIPHTEEPQYLDNVPQINLSVQSVVSCILHGSYKLQHNWNLDQTKFTPNLTRRENLKGPNQALFAPNSNQNYLVSQDGKQAAKITLLKFSQSTLDAITLGALQESLMLHIQL